MSYQRLLILVFVSSVHSAVRDAPGDRLGLMPDLRRLQHTITILRQAASTEDIRESFKEVALLPAALNPFRILPSSRRGLSRLRARELWTMKDWDIPSGTRVTFLERMVLYRRDVWRSMPISHPYYSRECNDLGVALLLYYAETGNRVLVDEVQALFSADRPLTATSYCDIAYELEALFLQTGDATLIDAGVELLRHGLLIHPSDLFDSNLWRRWTIAVLSILFPSIRLPAEPWDNQHMRTSLARMLQLRVNYAFGNITLLDETISFLRGLVDEIPDDRPSELASCYIALAAALAAHCVPFQDVRFLDEAITIQRKAMGQLPAEHRDGPSRALDLSRLLLFRHGVTGDLSVLDEACEQTRRGSKRSRGAM
jgi:hypothetical protein